ncbi:hypothetical protein EA462_01490 [Natrarchaeobius halalkaliphilus]|uniref:Uncharacterized protein n=1 Tax=Natrarchaeobius halalkaliphilus TaxID=1679091 RepID=A0A3N6N428_9EURY|nr:hypothetical protein [Natrarchaeobius halalkaliphilus]RQG92922.1 hypothetical protein EA462_01490 [Natrarchaeobius halalkaliphilus]
MNRRRYLAGWAAALAAFAGCLDGDGNGEANVDDRTGERALSRGIGQLNDAAIALQIEDELAEPESVDFDPDTPRTHLSTARDHLETAEAELEDERAGDIDELRRYATVLEAAIDVAGTVTDEALFEEIERIETALADGGDEHDRETTTELLDDRIEALETAGDRLTDAKAAIEAIDEGRYESLETVDLTDVESGVSTLEAVVISQSALASGYDATLEGDDDLDRGRAYADDGSHGDAEAAFLDAKASFETATETFEGGSDDAPDGLEGYFETALCRSNHLTDAAANFANASAAADDGDVVAAGQYRDDAEDALDAAASCGE